MADWVKQRADAIKAKQEKKEKAAEPVKKKPDPVKAKAKSPAASKRPSYPEPESYAEASTPVQRMAMQLEPQVMGIREVLHGLDMDTKIAVKRNFVNHGKFRSHCLDFVGAGLTYQDRVFQFYVVCLADTADWEEFFKFVDFGIHLKQTFEPSFIEKSFEQFRTWAFHDWVVAEQRAKRDPDEGGFLTKILEQPERLPDDVYRVLLSLKFKSLVANGKEKEARDFGQGALEKGAAIKSAWQKLDRKLKTKK